MFSAMAYIAIEWIYSLLPASDSVALRRAVSPWLPMMVLGMLGTGALLHHVQATPFATSRRAIWTVVAAGRLFAVFVPTAMILMVVFALLVVLYVVLAGEPGREPKLHPNEARTVAAVAGLGLFCMPRSEPSATPG